MVYFARRSVRSCISRVFFDVVLGFVALLREGIKGKGDHCKSEQRKKPSAEYKSIIFARSSSVVSTAPARPRLGKDTIPSSFSHFPFITKNVL